MNSKEAVYSSCLFTLEIERPENLIPPLGKAVINSGLNLESRYMRSDELLRINYNITRADEGLKMSQHIE